jgi:hypothetical protein
MCEFPHHTFPSAIHARAQHTQTHIRTRSFCYNRRSGRAASHSPLPCKPLSGSSATLLFQGFHTCQRAMLAEASQHQKCSSSNTTTTKSILPLLLLPALSVIVHPLFLKARQTSCQWPVMQEAAALSLLPWLGSLTTSPLCPHGCPTGSRRA